MILYQNSLLRLDYYPAHNLVEVNWPNLDPYTLPEAQLALTRLVNTIQSYDIVNLLVDGSRTSTNTLDVNQFKEVVSEVMQELQKTKLKRIARVRSADLGREAWADAITTAKSFPFEFKNFQNRDEALNWIRNTPVDLPE